MAIRNPDYDGRLQQKSTIQKPALSKYSNVNCVLIDIKNGRAIFDWVKWILVWLEEYPVNLIEIEMSALIASNIFPQRPIH